VQLNPAPGAAMRGKSLSFASRLRPLRHAAGAESCRSGTAGGWSGLSFPDGIGVLEE